MRWLLIAICFMQLSGCFGFGFYHQGEDAFPPTSLSRRERGEVFGPHYDGRRNQPYAKDEVLQVWGKPDTRLVSESNEIWTYHRELGFSGPMIGVLFPIPLVVPVGYRDTRLHFSGNTLTKVVLERGRLSFCGLTWSAGGRGQWVSGCPINDDDAELRRAASAFIEANPSSVHNSGSTGER